MNTILKKDNDLIKINKAIENNGIKKNYLAKKLKINRVSLSYWLNGKRPIPVLVKAKLWGLLGL